MDDKLFGSYVCPTCSCRVQSGTSCRFCSGSIQESLSKLKVVQSNKPTINADIEKLIAELEERQEAVDRIAQRCGATAERIFSRAASALRSQAEKLAIVTAHLNRDCEDAGVAMFQEEVKAALKEKA